MKALVSSSSINLDKRTDERKEIEKQLKENKDPKYYILSIQVMSRIDCRISKSHLLTMLP
jgi:hypothetical protein